MDELNLEEIAVDLAIAYAGATVAYMETGGMDMRRGVDLVFEVCAAMVAQLIQSGEAMGIARRHLTEMEQALPDRIKVYREKLAAEIAEQAERYIRDHAETPPPKGERH